MEPKPAGLLRGMVSAIVDGLRCGLSDAARAELEVLRTVPDLLRMRRPLCVSVAVSVASAVVGSASSELEALAGASAERGAGNTSSRTP